MLIQYNCAKEIIIKGMWFKITCNYIKVYFQLFKKKKKTIKWKRTFEFEHSYMHFYVKNLLTGLVKNNSDYV